MSGWAAWWIDTTEKPAHRAAAGLHLAALFLLASLVCYVVLRGATSNWESVWVYRVTFWNGWVLTILMSLASLVLSTLLGLLTALARRSSFLPLRGFATLYVEIIRGSPFLVLILIGFYGVMDQVGLQNRLVAGVILLTIFSAAYIAEIFRAGIESVGRSQLESAKAIGLDRAQTFRFVVFPQALRQTLPPLAGQFASLIKDSSLLSIIGITEFTFAAQQVSSATYSTLEALLPLAPGYLILTIPVFLFSRWLEKKSHFET